MTQESAYEAVKMTMDYFIKVDLRTADAKVALHRYKNVIPDEEFALIGNKHFFT